MAAEQFFPGLDLAPGYDPVISSARTITNLEGTGHQFEADNTANFDWNDGVRKAKGSDRGYSPDDLGVQDGHFQPNDDYTPDEVSPN